MHHLQRYLFIQFLRPLLLACGALAVLALLTQTLSNLSLIINQGETILLVLRIVALTLPQMMGLVLPVALFIAVTHGLHRVHSDSELAAAMAAGLSRWGVLAPVLRLTMIVMAVHLALGLWLQPWGHREMRRTLYDVRMEMAANLIQPGAFNQITSDLTIFVRSRDPNGHLQDLMIEDRRNNSGPVIYLAARGRLVQSEGAPTLILENGSIQSVDENGALSFLDFHSAPFTLAQIVEPPAQIIYKLSDRFLYELLYPLPTDFWERENADLMQAEGHARLAAPLYDLALALLAAMALLGGDYRRTGHAWRIAAAAAAALALRIAGFVLQAGAAVTPAIMPLQYALPAGASLFIMALYLGAWPIRRVHPLPPAGAA